MADQSDVEGVIVTTIAKALYPAGLGRASAIGQGIECKIYRGWPARHQLDSDLKAGNVNVTVFPGEGERNTTRYLRAQKSGAAKVIKLGLTADNKTITITGTPQSPLNAAVLVNGHGFIYPVQATDTLATIATGLAALISAYTSATSNGAVITIPAAVKLQARVGSVATVVEEIKRQQRSFRVTLWCSDPIKRDRAASIIDPALAALNFISLPDGTAGRIRYEKSYVNDVGQKENLYRRDLFYSVEFGTTLVESATQIVMQIFNLSGGIDPSAPALEIINS